MRRLMANLRRIVSYRLVVFLGSPGRAATIIQLLLRGTFMFRKLTTLLALAALLVVGSPWFAQPTQADTVPYGPYGYTPGAYDYSSSSYTPYSSSTSSYSFDSDDRLPAYGPYGYT